MSKLLVGFLNPKYKFTNWSYLIWWWIPIWSAFFIEVSTNQFESYRFLNLIENHFFAIICLITALLLKPIVFKQRLKHVFFSLFVFFTFAETLYFYWFSTNFSASSIFVLFETNVAEASEFLSFYINPFSVIYASLTLAYIAIYWIFQTKNKVELKPVLSTFWLIICLIISLFFIRITKLIDQNFPYLVVRGVHVYQEEQEALANLHIDKPKGSFTNVTSASKQPRTFVLIIGESTTKHNLELYGYPRPTNPKLSKRKEQLHVFEDVISTNAFTIGALKTALSLHNFEAKNESTIVQLFNQADFETHWISNQRPIGPYESIVTKISRASNFYTFTNTALAGKKTPIDEVLLPYLKTTLKRNTKDKFIVLHILGTHLQYKDRYPSRFEKFNNEAPNLKYVHAEAIQKRNEYDNAVLYNDFLIDEVIKQVEQENGESYVLYFADHGEEVFLNQDFAGHNDDNPSPSMFEVPFILWTNKNFQKSFQSTIDTSRAYSLNNFIHSLAELSDIQFDEFEPEKSIFSKDFKIESRFIKQKIDFKSFKSSFEKEN
ncbi:sulfatase-like hydrolase/transferase [Psychroflexus salis]|uniref:sulfatase-like hydrolase/transferase n=1 Tax=Psychroflexus salis TaxID=1526574 RepID=UPI001664C287|nr:sulfatase-like hydrolase/transferase [Psychroflexus salis]